MTASNDDIFKTLGRLEANGEWVRADLEAERVDTKNNRERVYEAIDEIKHRLNSLEATMTVTAQTVSQTRLETTSTLDRIKALEPKVRLTIRTLKQWKMGGAGILAAASLAGTALASLLWANAGAIWNWFKATF